METKYLRRIIKRKTIINKLFISLKVHFIRTEISIISRVLKSWIQSLFIHKLTQNDRNQSSVSWISNSTSVISLCDLVVQKLPGNLLELRNHFVHLLLRNYQIHLWKLVQNIPTQRSKLSSLLNQSMEETQSKQQSLKFLTSSVAFKELSWVTSISSQNVCFDSSWWFGCHFLTSLKKSHRESICWHWCQPKSEFARFDFLQFSFDLLQVTRSNVTILKDNPSSFLFCKSEKVLDNSFLTLTQR